MRWVTFVLVTACGRIGFDVTSTDDATPATGPFGTPVLIAELGEGDDPELALDERTILFTTSGTGASVCAISASTRASLAATWSAPTIVAELNTPECDAGPALSGDGRQLWYSSKIADGTSFDIYTATRANELATWGTMARVDEVSVDGTDDIGASVSADGLTMVFYRLLATDDLFMATRSSTTAAWSTPTMFTVTAGPGERSPFISRDGLTLYFISNANAGDRDIWMATRPDRASTFGQAVRLAEISGPLEEDDPWVSPDGHRIYFARKNGGNPMLYVAER